MEGLVNFLNEVLESLKDYGISGEAMPLRPRGNVTGIYLFVSIKTKTGDSYFATLSLTLEHDAPDSWTVRKIQECKELLLNLLPENGLHDAGAFKIKNVVRALQQSFGLRFVDYADVLDYGHSVPYGRMQVNGGHAILSAYGVMATFTLKANMDLEELNMRYHRMRDVFRATTPK